MSFFQNTCKPEGLGGSIMVTTMNIGGHAALAKWGLSSGIGERLEHSEKSAKDKSETGLPNSKEKAVPLYGKDDFGAVSLPENRDPAYAVQTGAAVLLFDWYLLCRSNFFIHFYPELKSVDTSHFFRYNRKEHIMHFLTYIPVCSCMALG
ncbi:MAG: hypothetical protein LUJ09_05940, partial [Firmicutes bacterium]|nr:hypothetical protein [Bacillota bacterium]